MSAEPGTASSLEHQLGKQILAAAEQVTDRQGLLDYLELVSSVSSALHHGLANATWSGQLSPGTPSSERPVRTKLLQQLTRVGDASHPGEVVFQHSLHDTIAAAGAAREVANTAWLAGMAEMTREGVDEAHSQRAKKDGESMQDLLQGMMRAVKSAVPSHLLGEVAEAMRKELEEVNQKRETSAP